MGPKIKAVVVLAVMFGLGVASGMTWQTYRSSQALAPRPHHNYYAAHRMQKLSKKLQLTPEQEQALRQIFQHAHERASEINEEVSWDLDDIHRDTVEEIHQVLTPEQTVKFDQLHQSHHRRKFSHGTTATPAPRTADHGDEEVNS